MFYKNKLPLHLPHVSVNQLQYLADVIYSGNLSAQGFYSQKCEAYFKGLFDAPDCLLTHSCTAALEICALLMELQADDEIIVPSYTFVSTANAFLLRSCKIRWADSQVNHPNVSASLIEPLINSNTRAIVVVHYAGMAVDLDPIIELCKKYKLCLIEDAAQALNGFYKGKRLGTFGDFSTFSFHDTKPISCGEGGLLVVNHPQYVEKARLILEKGTDRLAFLQGKTKLYQWLSVGSSYAASQLQASCLFAQLEELNAVFSKRKLLWNRYTELFRARRSSLYFNGPLEFEYSEYNTSVFYLEILQDGLRNQCIEYLNDLGIGAAFHYLPLHKSPFGSQVSNDKCPNSEYWSDHLIRLPIYSSMDVLEVDFVVQKVFDFFESKS